MQSGIESITTSTLYGFSEVAKLSCESAGKYNVVHSAGPARSSQRLYERVTDAVIVIFFATFPLCSPNKVGHIIVDNCRGKVVVFFLITWCSLAVSGAPLQSAVSRFKRH